MVQDRYKTFKEISKKIDFSVDMLKYKATDSHNSPITKEIIGAVKNSHLVIAMTEYSASAS